MAVYKAFACGNAQICLLLGVWMNVTIKYPASRPSSEVVRFVKKWELPEMQADSYSATVRTAYNPQTGQWEPVGQFGLVSVVQFDAAGNWIGDMSANTTFCNISTLELLYIASLQTADTFTVDQKMGWLLDGGDGDWGAPMMSGSWDKTLGQTWRDAKNVKLIGAVYAGQPVTLTGERRVFRLPWNGKTEDVPMSRIKPGTLQKVTVVDRANRYGEEPKGVIWLPLKFRTSSVWIFDRWLV